MCNLYIIKMRRRREREGKRWYIGGIEGGKDLRSSSLKTSVL